MKTVEEIKERLRIIELLQESSARSQLIMVDIGATDQARVFADNVIRDDGSIWALRWVLK